MQKSSTLGHRFIEHGRLQFRNMGAGLAVQENIMLYNLYSTGARHILTRREIRGDRRKSDDQITAQ